MKAFGILLIFLCCAYISHFLYSRDKKQVSSYEAVYDFVSYMRRRVENSKAPLDRIISDYSGNSSFSSARAAELASLIKSFIPEISSETDRLFSLIYDEAVGADMACAELECLCLERLNAVRENFEKRKKMNIYLPFIAGGMLVLLLI